MQETVKLLIFFHMDNVSHFEWRTPCENTKGLRLPFTFVWCIGACASEKCFGCKAWCIKNKVEYVYLLFSFVRKSSNIHPTIVISHFLLLFQVSRSPEEHGHIMRCACRYSQKYNAPVIQDTNSLPPHVTPPFLL
jgi:hypothetical protein